MSVTRNLKHFGEQHCLAATLTDVRIGLGYTYVELADGAAGIAWTPGRGATVSCTHLKRAGHLQELPEHDALQLLESDVHLERAVGLAAFNAVNSRVQRSFNDMEAIAMLDIGPMDHVVMVGHFAPLVPRITKTGCRFDVMDLDRSKPGIIDLRSGPEVLAQCDVAIITATSIINGTIDELLGHLRKNRAAVLLGPSTPLCPEAFAQTTITQLSGSMVGETEEIRRIVSQGGGTMLMKKHLHFVNIAV